MPVRVQGRHPDTKEVKCKGCGHILEYTLQDVNSYRHDVDQEFGYILCPRMACGAATRVPYLE